ncbi:MAG TPA: chemotaxis protein CheB, partial [Terriglobales bacterium]|nr:chemotaxis protein CheB [Terriglobales bacterium]
RHGGLGIVQDPGEARFSSMPRNAVRNDSPQYVLPVRQIAGTVIDLVMDGKPRSKEGDQLDAKLNNEVKIAELDMSAIKHEKHGVPSTYVCPECNGTLWEIREGELLRFRCRVGHAYGSESLMAAKNDELEGALWTALRTLEERAQLHSRLAENAARGRNPRVAEHFRLSAEDMHRQARTIRDLLLEREQPPLTGTDD